jgi:DNA-binding SARP family transcriptional activator/class 3 adenylate cyclase/pimeloyl-ACP methyl ester carboxylesterase
MGSELEVLRFGVLGPLEVLRDGNPVRVGGQRQRALLALLLVHANELVRIDQLLEALSGEQTSEAGVNAVRVSISRLRQVLRGGTDGEVLRTHPGGYVLAVGPAQFDLALFERLLRQARDSMAAEQPATAAALLRDALALWRGPPLADLALVEYFQDEIRRLEQLRLLALMERIDVDLALGGGAELIPEIESLVASDPLQERLRAQLMLALYRAGRQADALATYRQTSALLRVELGLEPSRGLQRLEQSILKRDPSLEPVRAPAAGLTGERRTLRRRSIEFGEVTSTLSAEAGGGRDVVSRFGADAIPDTFYAKSGDVHIAYQVITGSRAVDLVTIPPGVSNIEMFWEQPLMARFLRSLGSFSRMALFDKRGSGMSDRSIGHATLEERMDDTRAVMDAVGMERATVMGYSHGGPMAMLFAATYPERTQALVLFGTFARLLNAPGFELGHSREQVDRFLERWAAHWGTPETLTLPSYSPSKIGDDQYLRWLNRFERQSATPADLHAMVAMDREIDVRHILDTIRVPTLVLHRTGDRINRVEQARWIAAQIPDAEYIELPGDDHFPFVGDQDAVVAAIERFLTGHSYERPPERVLATVLFTDFVASTERLTQLGDRRWRELLDGHDSACDRELERFRGRRIKSTGDGLLAVFDGPARAIRCAAAILRELAGLGLDVRAGLHTGECDRRGDDISGIAVNIAARITALAGPGEVLVSRTVNDLIAGSQIALTDRGEHELRGVSGRWRLFALAECSSPA